MAFTVPNLSISSFCSLSKEQKEQKEQKEIMAFTVSKFISVGDIFSSEERKNRSKWSKVSFFTSR